MCLTSCSHLERLFLSSDACRKHVRKTHLIDDRMDDARREGISKMYSTKNVWPASLSHPLVKPNGDLQDAYFIKAIVPICNEQFKQINNPQKPCERPKFKKVAQRLLANDVIFGVLTANNSVGQIPPLQICDQNHDAGAQWYEELFSRPKDERLKDIDLDELYQNY